jgi:Lar family restriction alleviation protein
MTDPLALKPCPFCGSEDVKLHSIKALHPGEAEASHVYCNNCQAGTGRLNHYPEIARATAAIVVARWNMRAGEKPTEAKND